MLCILFVVWGVLYLGRSEGGVGEMGVLFLVSM